MINVVRDIDLSVYDSSLLSVSGVCFKTATSTKNSKVKISLAKLCYYTAKAMLTGTSIYTKNTAGYARSYFQIIPFLLGEKAGYWALNKDNKNVLRDFSKTSRVGELAQGINYFISVNELGAISVWDYREFYKAKLLLPGAPKGRLPDYVLAYRNGKYGVLESKGITNADPSDRLLDASGQVENGKNILMTAGVPLSSSYSSVVSFATSSKRMKRNTKAFMVDPLEDLEGRQITDFRSEMLFECSKHLCLAGKIELANKFKDESKKQKRLNISENQIQELSSTGSINLYDENGEARSFQFGFSENLVNYLTEDSSDIIQFEAYTENKTEFFEDGTYIKEF